MVTIARPVLFGVKVAVCLSLFGVGLGADPGNAGEKGKATAKNPPEWLKDVTLTKAGKEPQLKPCRLRYSLSWNHLINAGEATVKMTNGKDKGPAANEILTGEATARSSGVARLLWTYDCELKSQVDKESLRSLWFEHSETENSETVSYRTDFKPGSVVTVRKEKEAETGEIKSSKRTFKYDNVYDLLSSILSLRSLPLKNGNTITAVIQPFDKPYLVSFEVQGRESREYQGKDCKTIKLGVKIRKINKDLTLKDYKKLKTATLWVSEDDYRLPLEIRADIFIGYVAATLVEREFLTGSEEADNRAEPPVPSNSPAAGGIGGPIPDPLAKMLQWWENKSPKPGE
jgi:hypothetical protein